MVWWSPSKRCGHDPHPAGNIKFRCRIAQLAERLTLTQKVLGSRPSPAANFLSISGICVPLVTQMIVPVPSAWKTF